jgi:hypothetical protein
VSQAARARGAGRRLRQPGLCGRVLRRARGSSTRTRTRTRARAPAPVRRGRSGSGRRRRSTSASRSPTSGGPSDLHGELGSRSFGQEPRTSVHFYPLLPTRWIMVNPMRHRCPTKHQLDKRGADAFSDSAALDPSRVSWRWQVALARLVDPPAVSHTAARSWGGVRRPRRAARGVRQSQPLADQAEQQFAQPPHQQRAQHP